MSWDGTDFKKVQEQGPGFLSHKFAMKFGLRYEISPKRDTLTWGVDPHALCLRMPNQMIVYSEKEVLTA